MLVSKKNQNNFLEIYYYYNYLTTFFTLKNSLNFNFFFFKLLFSFYSLSKLPTKVNFFDKVKFYNKAKTSKLICLNKIFFNQNNSLFTKKIINLFFLFNYSVFNSNFNLNMNLRLFSIQNYNNKLIVFDTSKFITRWKETYDLIFNIFFYNFNPIVLSSIFFKNETLALNWNYNFFDINIWKYYFPFFIFKLNNYNRRTSFFFQKIQTFNINFFFITDCLYHYKNLYYLKKNNYYTIGLVNGFLNPWLVSYPVITLFENFLVQFFFIKLLVLIQKNSLFFKYNLFKKIWYVFKLKKNLIV